MNKPHWLMLFAAAVTLAAVLCVGCATAPVTKPPAEHFVAGLVLATCGTPIAAELVTDEGRVLFLVETDVDPESWANMLGVMGSLGDNAVGVELLPNCTKA